MSAESDPWGQGASRASPASVAADSWLDGARPEEPLAGHPFLVGEPQRYRDESVLGQGAMGRVTGARDQRLRRIVARKEARDEAGPGGAVTRRLAQEAWITAQLEHPGIVPVYDAGTTDEGRFFYTMRMVRGRALSERLTEAGDGAARLALVRPLRDVCEAVGYAHSRGVIHRDLKPSNLMIGSYGEAQVVDWGLARVLGRGEEPGAGMAAVPQEHAAATRVGAVIGTPAYMAPEQALGQPADRRSDVWSLGCILYQLLSGQRPHQEGETERVLARLRARAPLSWAPCAGSPPELVAICRRALALEPAGRYDDAKQLADELSAWLEGRRVGSYRYSSWELLARLLRRYRAPLLVAAAALLLGALGAVEAWRRTTAERDRAVVAEQRSEEALGRLLLADALARAERGERAEAELGALAAWRRGADEALVRGILAGFAAGAAPELITSWPRPPCGRLFGVAPDGSALLCGTSLEGEDWLTLYEIDGGIRWRLPREEFDRAWFSHEGAQVEVLRERVSWRGLDVRSGAVLWSEDDAPMPRGVTVHGADVWITGAVDLERYRRGQLQERWAGLPDAMRGAVAADGWALRADRSRGVWAGPDGALERILTLEGDAPSWGMGPELQQSGPLSTVASVALLPDGQGLLGTEQGRLVQLDLRTVAAADGPLREEHRVAGIPVGAIRQLQPSVSGAWVLVQGEEGAPRLWDPVARQWGAALPLLDRGGASWIDDEQLITVGERVARWRIPAPSPAVLGAPEGLQGVAVRPAGWAAVGGPHATLWDARGRVEETGAHPRAGKDVAVVGPDGGQVLLAYLTDGEPALFLAAPGAGLAPHLALAAVRRAVSLVGDRIVVAHPWGWWELKLNEEQQLQPVRTWGASQAAPHELTEARESGLSAGELVSSPGKQWALGVFGSDLWRWAPTGPPTVLAPAPEALCLAIADDGETWAYSSRERAIVRRGANTEPLLEVPARPGTLPLEVALSSDGALLGLGWFDGRVEIWDVPARRLLATAAGHRKRVSDLEWSPDGRELISGSWDRRLWRWSAEALGPLDRLQEQIEARWGRTAEDQLERAGGRGRAGTDRDGG